VFKDIEWKRFETLCAELFAQAGFDARTQSHGADGGVDIVLHSSNASGPAAIVQCKHWANRLVGVKEVRELLGVMAAGGIARGTFATSGGFTQEALRFAHQNRIHTLDAGGLLALIGKRTPEQQRALLAHAYQGEYWRPTCASCGKKLMERTARNGGPRFWGCPDYPRCRFTLPMRTN
jgi:restriction system protein